MTLINGKICPPFPHFCVLLILFSLRGVLPGATYDPEFDYPLPNLTAKLGSDVAFTVTVKHLGEYKVAWIRSEQKMIIAYHTHMVTHNPRYLVTHNGHNTWTLHIKNVQQNDSGTYMVQINTDPMRMQQGSLEVVVGPDIIDELTSRDVTVLEGMSTVLKCKATGHPLPKVRWKRQDGRPLPLSRELLSQGEKVEYWEGEMLPLRILNHTDTGEFQCIANSSVPPPVVKNIMLSVQSKPSIKVSNHLVATPSEVNATLQCEIESVPKPFTSWNIKGGQIILNTDGKYVLTSETVNDYKMKIKLTILNLRPQDFADYNCSAWNTLGEASSVIKLQQIFPPMPPKTTTTTHRPIKHPSAKDHERLDGSGKHAKVHRIKQTSRGHHQQSGGSSSRTHNTANAYEDLPEEDLDNGDMTQHVTTVMSNNFRRTTTPPKNSWSSGNNGRNRGRNSASGISMKRGLPLILIQLIPPIIFGFLIYSEFLVVINNT